MPMPRQNRVTPAGELIVTNARGQFMGNRGVLHNDNSELTAKRWTHQQWIICLLEFKGRKRDPLMKPGCYTELFFGDEATALAAGHRPCWECNRGRYNQFKAAWLKGNPEYGFDPKVSIKEIDRVLHQERTHSARKNNPYRSKLGDLPDGVFVMTDDAEGQYFLIQYGMLMRWSPEGYKHGPLVDSQQEVSVLTPKSTVNAIRAGYSPSK